MAASKKEKNPSLQALEVLLCQNPVNEIEIVDLAISMIASKTGTELLNHYLTHFTHINTENSFIIGCLKMKTFFQLGKFPEALACCNQIQEMRPSDEEIRYIKGRILIELNCYDEASQIFKNLLDLPSSDVIDALYEDKGEQKLNEPLPLSLGKADLYYCRALALKEEQRNEEAFNYLIAASKLQPDDHDIETAIANFYDTEEQIPLALDSIETKQHAISTKALVHYASVGKATIANTPSADSTISPTAVSVSILDSKSF